MNLFDWHQPDPECEKCREEGLVPVPAPGDMHEPKPYTGELDWYEDLGQRPETD